MKKQLSILMLARPNLFSYSGGDTTQIRNTAKALGKLGVHVDVNPDDIRYDRYDLMHFFNMIDPEDILGHVLRAKLPYVLSTVYLDYSEYDKNYRKDLFGWLRKVLHQDQVEYLKTVAKWILKGESLSSMQYLRKGHRNSILFILKNASLLLPNSENEYRRVVDDYGIRKPYRVVPNAVDQLFLSVPSANKMRKNILCVSRIEGNKNHLNLIRAANYFDMQLYLVGRPAMNQKRYYAMCRRISPPNVHFTGFVEHQELLSHYQQAKVHVLPSWFETTGLSSLEAGAMGANLVVSDRGDVRDYFGDEVWYCDPADPKSIAEAIRKAYEAPQKERLQSLIREKYTWDKTARVTLEAYEEVLKAAAV